MVSRDQLKIKTDKYKKLVKKKKSDWLKNWFDNRDNSEKLGQLNKKLQGNLAPNGDIPLFNKPDGSQMDPEETINKVTCDLFPGCIDEVDYEPTKKVRDEANMSKKAVDINDPAASFITVESVTTAFKSFG